MFKLATVFVVPSVTMRGVLSQVSTASLFPIIDANGGSLQGQIVGTGTDGTTYALSGSPTGGAPPVTLTLVQDTSHVSEFAAESTGSVSAEFHVECGFDSSSRGVCTLEQILANGENITTITRTDTGTVTLTPVPVSTGSAISPVTSASASPTQPASATQSSSATSSLISNSVGAIMSLLLAFVSVV